MKLYEINGPFNFMKPLSDYPYINITKKRKTAFHPTVKDHGFSRPYCINRSALND